MFCISHHSPSALTLCLSANLLQDYRDALITNYYVSGCPPHHTQARDSQTIFPAASGLASAALPGGSWPCCFAASQAL